MTLVPTSKWFVALIGVACLVCCGEAGAQSQTDARKRSFAAILSRSITTERAEATIDRARARNRLFRASQATVNAIGVPAASPVLPGGFPLGSEAFVEKLYQLILGRAPVPSEVAYWARKLLEGVTAETVGELLWHSREHRGEMRHGRAKDVSLKEAVKIATAYWKANEHASGG